MFDLESEFTLIHSYFSLIYSPSARLNLSESMPTSTKTILNIWVYQSGWICLNPYQPALRLYLYLSQMVTVICFACGKSNDVMMKLYLVHIHEAPHEEQLAEIVLPPIEGRCFACGASSWKLESEWPRLPWYLTRTASHSQSRSWFNWN